MFNSIWRSLRLKVTLGVVLPLLLILGIFTYIGYNRRRDAVLSNLTFLNSQTSRVIEHGLYHEMLSRNTEGLQHMLDAIAEDQSIQAVYILNISGRVVFSPGKVGTGDQLDNQDANCQPCHHLPAWERPESVIITLPNGERIFRSMNPIQNKPECQECHNPDQRLAGLLLTDISMASLEAPLAADLREDILWWIVTILTTVIIVNLVVSRVVIRRLENIAQTLSRFGRGQLGLRLSTGSPDEIGELSAAFNSMGQRIQNEEAENRTLSENLSHEAAQRSQLLKRLITIQEEERKRVARDLHDDLGQDLAGLAVNVDATERLIDNQPQQAHIQLQRIRTLLSETTNRTYNMILSLRPSSLDDLGLVPALHTHAERVLKDAHIELEIDAKHLAHRLPPEIETALFRTYQEALNNVVRYSSAKHVHLKLATYNGWFEGEIVDDGQGFDTTNIQASGTSPRGLGLLGMQERILLCDGKLEVTSQIDVGTQIKISIPIPEAQRE